MLTPGSGIQGLSASEGGGSPQSPWGESELGEILWEERVLPTYRERESDHWRVTSPNSPTLPQGQQKLRTILPAQQLAHYHRHPFAKCKLGGGGPNYIPSSVPSKLSVS
ncbi:UNVERIFIED_CONTAM: hypothetical protein K2H54_047942 [Gekko kuhli]